MLHDYPLPRRGAQVIRNGSDRSLGWSQRWFDSTAEHMEAEEWRPLPAAPGAYEVSSLGRARRSIPGPRTHVGRPMTLEANLNSGYLMVSPFVNGRVKRVSLHRQMCIAFHGEPAPGMVARHLNDDKLDNRISNLAWGTRKENGQDAVRNGRLGRRNVACIRGHAWTPDNTYRLRGHRMCRTCESA